MLKSTESEICHAHNVKKPKMFGILTLISMLNTKTSESLKARLFFNFSILV